MYMYTKSGNFQNLVIDF